MKKLLFVVIFFLLAILSRAEGFGIYVGGKLGYQTTKLSAARVDINAGLNEHMVLGGFGRFVIKNVVIQPEMMLFSTSQIFDLNGTDATHLNISVETEQQSLAMPLMFGYQFFDQSLVKVRATAGLVMYYVLGQNNQNNYNNQNLDIKANNITWGSALSVGVDFMMFTFDISYSFGLTNIVEREIVEIGGHNFVLDNTRQNFFTVTVGVKLFNYIYEE